MGRKSRKSKRKKQAQKKTSPTPRTSEQASFFKQFLLAILSIVVLYLFFSIPYYNRWLTGRIFGYYQQLSHQLETMQVERRIVEREGYDYLIPKMIDEQTPDSAIILLPPQSYVKNHCSKRFYQWHHANWNYYYFGPGHYINYDPQANQDLSQLTHSVMCQEGKIQLVPIDSPDRLQMVLSEFEKSE